MAVPLPGKQTLSALCASPITSETGAPAIACKQKQQQLSSRTSPEFCAHATTNNLEAREATNNLVVISIQLERSFNMLYRFGDVSAIPATVRLNSREGKYLKVSSENSALPWEAHTLWNCFPKQAPSPGERPV